MDTQSKLLNKQYVETRIREIKEIRSREVEFKIEESDRAFSKTIYIHFFCKSTNADGKWFKGATLRISDHEQQDCIFPQFIIKPSEYLTKKKKAEFMRWLELTTKRAKKKSLYMTLNKLSNDMSNAENRADFKGI